MASAYPGALDSFATNRADATIAATTHKNDHNDANDAINKIEAELGITPSGSHTTVRSRLDALVGVADAFSHSGASTLRTLPADPTIAEIRNYLCTLVDDIKALT